MVFFNISVLGRVILLFAFRLLFIPFFRTLNFLLYEDITFFLHVLLVAQLVTDRHVAFSEATGFNHDITDGPCKDFPSLFAFISMCGKQILVWLKIRHYVYCHLVAEPAQSKDDEGQELHGVKRRAHP